MNTGRNTGIFLIFLLFFSSSAASASILDDFFELVVAPFSRLVDNLLNFNVSTEGDDCNECDYPDEVCVAVGYENHCVDVGLINAVEFGECGANSVKLGDFCVGVCVDSSDCAYNAPLCCGGICTHNCPYEEDPCEGVNCDSGEICIGGSCILLEDPCESVTCSASEFCVAGECVEALEPCDPPCGSNSVCVNGQCQFLGVPEDSCNNGYCQSPSSACGNEFYYCPDSGTYYCSTQCGSQCGVDSDCGAGQCLNWYDGLGLCSSAICTCSCNENAIECDGFCVNPLTDNDNCGGCGNQCLPGYECTGGVCTSVLTCLEGGALECPGVGLDCCPVGTQTLCVNVVADPYNCGECGNVCQVGNEICFQGACTTCGNGSCEQELGENCFNCTECSCGPGRSCQETAPGSGVYTCQ